MLNLLSNTLELDGRLEEYGVFNPLLDMDSNYFINIKRLKVAKTPEFVNSYENINKRFRDIGLLLANSSGSGDKLYRAAFKLFDFPEVNGICLGYSDGKHGSGFGESLRKQILADAKQIIDAGVNEPEIFHLVGLFEQNVGPDRLSDMIACIIKDDIEAYTKRVNIELGITPEEYPSFEFEDGLLINPFKNQPLLILPKEILHELPIARDWEDIDRVCKEIEAIRREINDAIGNKWGKMSRGSKKDFLKELILGNPKILTEILGEYREATVDQYNFELDPRGEHLIAKIADQLPRKHPIELNDGVKSSLDIALTICNKFKDLVENNKVSELLYVDGKPRNEKIVQRAFYCVADSYCNAFNMGISVETDSGRGPVDFKFESGYDDRTLVEIKLTTSNNLVHGMETQLQEYAKAEKTNKLIYLAVHNGGPQKRIDSLIDVYNTSKEHLARCPELVFVDATPKDSASKYKADH